uniref:Uncharacterized protein n=1 Tax=Romanomermis culicivorax TaxID=13658 RepID=A0A915L7L0_ROMCU
MGCLVGKSLRQVTRKLRSTEVYD